MPGRSLIAFLLAFAFLEADPARAERFLSLDEAQALCFPEADRFEARIVRLTDTERKAIERRARVPVLNRGNRVWLARQGTNLLGVLFLDYVLGKHELIDYVVALEPSGAVRQIEILEYRESYGGEVRGAKWRAQFKGKTASAPLKVNGDIYNISGATISCRNVSEGVKRVLATFDLVRADLVARDGLPDGRTSSPR